jgi:hypothetical protein
MTGLSWYLLERKRASRANNLFFVYFDGTTGELCNLGPSSDDDILRFHGGLAALIKPHENRIRRYNGGSSFDIVDLVLFE